MYVCSWGSLMDNKKKTLERAASSWIEVRLELSVMNSNALATGLTLLLLKNFLDCEYDGFM